MAEIIPDMAPEIIDAHHHLWHYTVEEYGWIGPTMEVLQRDYLVSDLETEMHEAGISGSIAVQARQSVAETEWLLDLAEHSTAILGVVGWVPLVDENLPQILERLCRHPALKGVRHVIQDEPDDNFILRADFNRGIAGLLGTGLVYDILIHERHLPQAEMFVARHPQQTFVLDHLAKPLIRHRALAPWRDHLLRLAAHENVHCKLSGMVTEADWSCWTPDDLRPYLDAALEAFGAERLMAGSDWPVCLVASTCKKWWTALQEWCSELPPAERKQVLGGTARRVYRLA